MSTVSSGGSEGGGGALRVGGGGAVTSDEWHSARLELALTDESDEVIDFSG